jgi:hypothetical protein
VIGVSEIQTETFKVNDAKCPVHYDYVGAELRLRGELKQAKYRKA